MDTKQMQAIKQVPTYDNSMMLFTNRWVALSIDIVTVFIPFFIIKTNFLVIYNWPLFILLYTVLHILLPLIMDKSRSIGKIIMKVSLTYPASYSKTQRKLFYVVRETIKLTSIIASAGIILIITPLIISEKEKPTLHELFSKVIAKRILGKNEIATDDVFDGKLKL